MQVNRHVHINLISGEGVDMQRNPESNQPGLRKRELWGGALGQRRPWEPTGRVCGSSVWSSAFSVLRLLGMPASTRPQPPAPISSPSSPPNGLLPSSVPTSWQRAPLSNVKNWTVKYLLVPDTGRDGPSSLFGTSRKRLRGEALEFNQGVLAARVLCVLRLGRGWGRASTAMWDKSWRPKGQGAVAGAFLPNKGLHHTWAWLSTTGEEWAKMLRALHSRKTTCA